MKNKNPFFLLIFISLLQPAFAQQEIELYPTPFSDELFIATTPNCGDSIQLEVYNRWGIELINDKKHLVIKPDTIEYKLKLQNGVYILRYQQNNQEVITKAIRSGDSSTVTINLVISDNNLYCFERPFEIYPNPSSDGLFKIHQTNIGLPYKITINDAVGNLISQKTVENRNTSAYSLNLSKEADGTYFIKIESQHGTNIHRLILAREN